MNLAEEKAYYHKWEKKLETMSANELTTPDRVYDLHRLAMYLMAKFKTMSSWPLLPNGPEHVPTWYDALSYQYKGAFRDHLGLEQLNTQIRLLEEENKKLQEDQAKLNALEAAGVDNWVGYNDAMEIYEDSKS